MDNQLARHIAQHLRADATDLTRRWIAHLEQRLDVPPERTLPTDSMLNHIPEVLRTIADFPESPGEDPLDSMVRNDLGMLADLRQRQGFSPEEVLVEFGILSDLIEDSIADAVERWEGDCARRDIVRTIGQLKDAVFLLGTETAARFRQWDERRQAEQVRLFEAYTAMLSHELGNRLGAAETAVTLIIEEGESLEPDRVRAMHGLILRSLRSGRETVQGVRSLFSRNHDGAIRTLPLATVVRDTVHEMKIAASSRGIELVLIDEGPDEPIDAERLPLALFNLVTNAICHHDVADGSGRITVSVEPDPAGWAVAVTDDGPGIPDSLRDRIFQPLVRSPNGTGAGLGLAIAREAVEQMGGRIWFEPATERGTRFRFTIPRLDGAE